MYAELRPMLMDKHIETDDGIGKVTNARQMQLILDAVDAKRKELEKEEKSHLFPFGLKIIYCTPRSIPISKMVSELNDCIDLKVRYPNLICGKSKHSRDAEPCSNTVQALILLAPKIVPITLVSTTSN